MFVSSVLNQLKISYLCLKYKVRKILGKILLFPHRYMSHLTLSELPHYTSLRTRIHTPLWLICISKIIIEGFYLSKILGSNIIRHM